MSGHGNEKCWKLHLELRLKLKLKSCKVSTMRHVATPVGVDHLANQIKRVYSWLACFGGIIYEEIEA